MTGFQAAGHGPPPAPRVMPCTKLSFEGTRTPSCPTVGGATVVAPRPVKYFQRVLPDTALNGRPWALAPLEKLEDGYSMKTE